MARRRKRRMISGKTTVIYISLILSLSLIGVGYAAWNDTIIINTTISTGNTKVGVDTRHGRIYENNEEYLDVIVEDNNLVITGKLYPETSNSLRINILDTGTVPVVFSDEDEPIRDARVSLVNDANYGFNTFNNYSILDQGEIRESFILNINPGQDYEEEINDASLQTLSTDISDLEDKIEQYKNNDKYIFQYNVLFEQAL